MGWLASDRILESPTSFFYAAGGGFDVGVIRLGRPWAFSSPGVSIKPIPSRSLSHPAMSELLRRIRVNHIRADPVKRLDVRTKSVSTALTHHRPTDSLQAKFSMEFRMAALVMYGGARLIEFRNEVVQRP